MYISSLSQTKSFQFPGTVGIGLHGDAEFQYCGDKKVDGEVKDVKEKLPVEFAAEVNLDLQTHDVKARAASKMLCGKECTLQMMYDQDFKLSSGFTYTPHKNFKFMWSDQVDTKKLFTNPKDGIDYKYGFTVELNYTPDI